MHWQKPGRHPYDFGRTAVSAAHLRPAAGFGACAAALLARRWAPSHRSRGEDRLPTHQRSHKGCLRSATLQFARCQTITSLDRTNPRPAPARGCPVTALSLPRETMRTTVSDPATLRRRLKIELRRARKTAGLTQQSVADALDWSPSKIIRIESGSVAVSVTDLKALAEHYSISDRFEDLAAMAKGSKKQPWSEYSDILPQETMRYFGYESSVSILRQFEISFMPGLLQTEEYARAILTDVFGRGGENLNRLVKARLERQELFDKQEPPETFFLLDEAVLRRQIGGPDVMRRQLRRLEELAESPRISIQVLPFSTGGYFGLKGPFVYLEFADPEDDDVLYLENPYGDAIFRDATEVTEPYREAFWDMEKIASPREALGTYLEAARRQAAGTTPATVGRTS
jgi:transcriptional regulator with XRE-family HTH domain